MRPLYELELEITSRPGEGPPPIVPNGVLKVRGLMAAIYYVGSGSYITDFCLHCVVDHQSHSTRL